jgi:magnesium-transporting ATPase (P-type)
MRTRGVAATLCDARFPIVAVYLDFMSETAVDVVDRDADKARRSGAVDPLERTDLLLAHLGTRFDGLTSREAERRAAQYGRKEISRSERPRRVEELVRQLVHPLASLLWAAASLALVSGSRTLAVAIVVVILVNAMLAYTQELQSERATEALKQLLPARARVRRAGTEHEVDAAALLPGDVVVLEEGDRLSADVRLIDGSLEVDMAALTEGSSAERFCRALGFASAPSRRCS